MVIFKSFTSKKSFPLNPSLKNGLSKIRTGLSLKEGAVIPEEKVFISDGHPFYSPQPLR